MLTRLRENLAEILPAPPSSPLPAEPGIMQFMCGGSSPPKVSKHTIFCRFSLFFFLSLLSVSYFFVFLSFCTHAPFMDSYSPCFWSDLPEIHIIHRSRTGSRTGSGPVGAGQRVPGCRGTAAAQEEIRENYPPAARLGGQTKGTVSRITTICPGSSDPFYLVTYYIKWVTTSST